MPILLYPVSRASYYANSSVETRQKINDFYVYFIKNRVFGKNPKEFLKIFLMFVPPFFTGLVYFLYSVDKFEKENKVLVDPFKKEKHINTYAYTDISNMESKKM